MASKKNRKGRSGIAEPLNSGNGTILGRIENFFKGWTRYPSTFAVLLWIVSSGGWILDRTLFMPGERHELPQVTIYNGPAEKLDASVLSYYQYPAYKALTMGYGSSLYFQYSHRISPEILGSKKYLMIYIDGEQAARAFDLSQVAIPFTIQINSHGSRHLVTVENVDDKRVQIRTYKAVN